MEHVRKSWEIILFSIYLKAYIIPTNIYAYIYLKEMFPLSMMMLCLRTL